MPLGGAVSKRAARQRGDDDAGAARFHCLREAAGVPVAAAILDEQQRCAAAHPASSRKRPQRKLASTMSGASSPAWNELPVSRLETVTAAGLNSMGSIL